MKYLLFYLVTIYIGIPSSFSQSPQLVFKHYTTEQGLPSSEVYDLLQDRDGFIWISTDNGVSRFNGYEFENFGSDQGLKNNVVFHLKEDHWGRIWMSTLSGSLYYFQQDSIYPYAYNEIIQNNRKNLYLLNQFYLDTLETMHIGIMGLGFLQIDADGNSQLIARELLCTSVAYLVDKEVLYTVVISTSKESELDLEQCLKFNSTAEKIPFIEYRDSIKVSLLPYPYTRNLNQTGLVVPLKDNSRLFILNPKIYHLNDEGLIRHGTYPYSINSFWESDNGKLFIGNSLKGGCRIYDQKEDIFLDNYESILEGYTVSHILEDQKGGYWISTVENGFFYASTPSIRVLNAESGLSADNISAVSLKNKEELYVGLKNGDVYYWNQGTNELRQLPRTVHDKEIYALQYDSISNELWKGAQHLQVYRNGKWTSLQHSDGREAAYRANKNFRLYPHENLLLGTNGGDMGISIINTKKVLLERVPPCTKGRTFTIFKDKDDRIWVGRVNGLFEYSANQLRLTEMKGAPFSHRIEDIDQLADGRLVLGTKGEGIIIWEAKEYIQIKRKDGLSSNMIENIHIDQWQNIWVGTLNGLNKITLNKDQTFQIRSYRISNGLPSNEINDLTSWGNAVYAATTKGLVKIIESPIDSFPTSPFIEQITVNSELIGLDSIINLPYYKNRLQISFLALNYQMRGKIPYRYRLEKNQAWDYTYNRSVNYTVLASGNYTFEVQAQNEAGIWSDSAILYLTIRTPVWKKIWFWPGIIFSLSVLLLRYYQIRIRRLERSAIMEREINSLKQSALRAQMNPHFIFNCLNSIQRTLLRGDKLRAAKYLSQFAQLIRLVMESTTQEKIALSKEVEILEIYIELEKMRSKDAFSYRVYIDDRIESNTIMVPPLLVQPYIENAIIHGLLPSKKTGQLHISYSRENNFLLIEILDNGIGIEASKKKKGTQNTHHKSIGMSLPVKRLQLMDTDPYQKVNIIEQKHPDGSISGTLVQIRIKWSSLHPIH